MLTRRVNFLDAHLQQCVKEHFRRDILYLKWLVLSPRGSVQKLWCSITLEEGQFYSLCFSFSTKPFSHTRNKKRFPAPRHPRDFARQKIIDDIEKNANRVWASGRRCKVAHDFLRVEVPPVSIAGDALGGPSSSSGANHGRSPISAVASNYSEIAHVDTPASVPSTSWNYTHAD
jgi:hypothetical protein